MRRLIFISVMMFLTGVAARAADAPVVVSGAWVRASLGQSGVTAAYLKIENRSAKGDTLLDIATPEGMASVHESVMKDGMMQMKPAGTVFIKAGGTVEFKPGGLHVMVTGLKTPLKAGQTLPLTLRFEGAGKIDVKAEVRGIGAAN